MIFDCVSGSFVTNKTDSNRNDSQFYLILRRHAITIETKSHKRNNKQTRKVCTLPCADGVICCASNDVDVAKIVSMAKMSINTNRNRNLMIERLVDRAVHTFEIILLSCGLAHFVCLRLEMERKWRRKKKLQQMPRWKNE